MFFGPFLLVFIISICKSLNHELFKLVPSELSNVMKEFMRFVIQKNSHEKDGFLFIMINKIQPEFSDFAMQELSKNCSVIILNFDVDKASKPMLNPNHFKFVLTDPEGELNHAESSFQKVRASRAKIVLILTKQPAWLFVTYILNSYWKINCINVILAYEIEDRIEVITMNPFIPHDPYVNLTLTKYSVDLFKEKGRNLHNYPINALLTYTDRSKVKKISKQKYDGKDFVVLDTIFRHLNAKLKVISINSTKNPWLEFGSYQKQLEEKNEILRNKSISLLIKSESFTVNDGVVENLYPHTQNDLVALIPKSPPISLFKANSTILSKLAWITVILLPMVLIWVLIFLNHFNAGVDIAFDIIRITITNNSRRFSQNSIQKLLVVGFLLYSYMLNMGLQSKTTSILTITGYEPDIETIDNLVYSRSKLLCLPSQIREVHKKYQGTKYETFSKSLIPIQLNKEELEQVIIDKQFDKLSSLSLLVEKDLGIFVAKNRLLRKNGAPMYHLVKESLIPSFQAFKVTHGSPLLTVINQQLRKLNEAGFIDLWTKNSIYQAIIEGTLDPVEYDDMQIKPLSLKSVTMALYILVIGLLISIFAFIMEVLF